MPKTTPADTKKLSQMGDPEDGAGAVPRSTHTGFSSAALDRLGEVLTEVRHLGKAIGRS